MKRISRNYVDFLESVVISLLDERTKSGNASDIIKMDLDRGPTGEIIKYNPVEVSKLITKTYKEFVENGWR